MEDTIDWILFSKELEEHRKEFIIEDPPFKTDHRIVEQKFEFKDFEKKTPKRQYTPKDNIFENKIFFDNLEMSIGSILSDQKLSYGDRLETCQKKFIELSKEHERKEKRKE